jgi:hypothetical protein
MSLGRAGLAIPLAVTACGFEAGPASDAIREADCDELTRCIPLVGADSFAVTPSECQGDVFIASCGVDQARLCASAIESMPLTQCALFAKGDLPLSCETCVENFHALPDADADAGTGAAPTDSGTSTAEVVQATD